MACSLAHEELLRARGLLFVAGVDEAGRGPLAGPVVAAAVILPEGFRHDLLNDSKQLTERRRDAIFSEITTSGKIRWAHAIVESDEIDRLNILRATHEAMRRAVAKLDPQPQHVLIDGLPVRPFPVEQTALVGGDALSFSIAAASVIAKVTRDRIMVAHDAKFPGYDFARHKGYGTPQHLAALKKHGPCPIHRRSFLPVRQAELGL
ncbi:MAG: ribonuclease HII [Verrucomicrobiota bacterium]|nr:ribonuclease HII [Verrucomicrobiota bacterium]